jgi:hypothetical protein
MKFSTPVFLLAMFTAVTYAIPTPQTREMHDARELELVEERGAGGAAEVLMMGIEMAVKGISNLINDIKKDKADRGKFTSALVSELSKKNPKFNYIVCHTKHETK